jgi:putative serine protease PepD
MLAGCRSKSNNAQPAAVATPASSATAATSAPAGHLLQQEFRSVVKTVSPEVVQIQTNTGLGSGVVFDRKGDTVTNAHVVAGAQTLSVTLSTGAQHPASIVGINPQNDIAVIRVSGAKPRPATFRRLLQGPGRRHRARDRQPAGPALERHAGNRLLCRADGVRGKRRRAAVRHPDQRRDHPGNSGGALVDIEGAVIGIPTLAAIDPEFGETPAPGIGLAIPSNTARNFAAKLIASGSVARTGRAYLGVVITTILTGGVLVESVQPGGPATKAGIKPGEVIVSVAGQQTPSTDVLTSVLATLRPGQTVPVQVLAPSGQVSTVQVTLGSQPGH